MAAKKIPKEFLGAFKAGHRLASKDFIDEELSHELLKKTMRGCKEAKAVLEWLTKFNNEYHKNVIKKGDPNALHNDEKRKELYRSDYARNSDVYTKCQLVRNLKGF